MRKQTSPDIFRGMKHFLLFAAVLVSLCGCQSTPGTGVWRKPGYFGGPKKSVAVVVLVHRDDVRKEYEKAIAAELEKSGVAAQTTFGRMPTGTILADKPAAIESIKHTGVQAVLVARLADPKTLETVQISPTNSGNAMQPWQNWFDFFTAPSAFAVNPATMAQSGKTGIQAVLYESPSGTLLWSGTLVTKAGTPDLSEERFASTLAGALKKALLIP